MALHLLPSDQIETSCRRRIDSCELWLRRVVHDVLFPVFGADYVNTAMVDNNPVFSNNIKKAVAFRWDNAAAQPTRAVDTLLFDDLGVIIGRHDVYQAFFRAALEPELPLGAEHIRRMLATLVPIRNKLSHANGASLSMLEAERTLCYCNDIISAIQAHYATINMADQFPAPQFTRVSDSFGNVWRPSATRQHHHGTQILRSGDLLRIEVEVDSTFTPSDYTVAWTVCNITGPETAAGPLFCLALTDRHVGVDFTVMATLTSNKAWHRHSNVDDLSTITYKVIPL